MDGQWAVLHAPRLETILGPLINPIAILVTQGTLLKYTSVIIMNYVWVETLMSQVSCYSPLLSLSFVSIRLAVAVSIDQTELPGLDLGHAQLRSSL